MEAAKQNKTFIFSSEYEDYFIFAVNIFFISFTLLFAYKPSLYVTERTSLYLIRDYLFFNTLHVPMSLYLILMVPELKTWVRRKNSILGNYKYEIATVFFVFIIISIFGHVVGQLNKPLRPIFSSPTLFFAGSLLFGLLNIYHGLGQNCGVSLTIQKTNLDPTNDKAERRERSLFRFLTWAVVLFSCAFQLQLAYDNPWTQPFASFFSAVLALFAISIILNAFTFAKNIRKKKVFFLSFLVVYPFITFVPFVSFVIGAQHGIVYFFITKKMVKNSSLEKTKKRKMLSWMALTALVWGIICIPRYYEISKYLGSYFLLILLGFLTSVDLFHFWLDRNIFRMRHKENRELIAPLLLK